MRYIAITIAIISLTGCNTTKPTVKDPANPTKKEINALLDFKYGR